MIFARHLRHRLTCRLAVRDFPDLWPVTTASIRSFGGSHARQTKNAESIGAGLTLSIGLTPFKALALDSVTMPFDNGERPLVKYPQKRAMIGITSRPPQLETPFSVFNEGPITPNDAFFVRISSCRHPALIDPDTFTLEIKGKVDRPLKLSLKDIKKMRQTEIVAVNQCSGNSRGFVNSRVAGGQLATER